MDRAEPGGAGLALNFYGRFYRSRCVQVLLLLVAFASGGRQRSEAASLRVADLIEREPVPADRKWTAPNPVVRGWLNYYGRFYRSRCVQVLRHVNEALGKWRFRRRERAAMHWLGRIARRDPDLFVLWRQGVRPEVGV